MSRDEVEMYKNDPVPAYWVTAAEAARILGVTRERARQLALKGFLPNGREGPNGRRWYRRQQILVIANARNVEWRSTPVPE